MSADPPITEVEIKYLARIRETVARLIIVLNKIDLIEPHEREKAITFLRSALVDHAGLDPFTPIFSLSARDALRAKESGNAEAFGASGFAELERRIAIFDEAAERFDVERRNANDFLAGDRLRALQELEAEADRLRIDSRAMLERELDEALAAGEDSNRARERLSAKLVPFFEDALREVIRRVGARLEEVLRIHQHRADELITLVRQTAANLLEIPFHAPETSEAFEAKHEPFWVTAARTAELNLIPPGAFDPFFPAPMRKRRMRKRLLEEIEIVVTRNVENLRWATRQNLEDTFRRFGAELDERLAMSLDATRGAMQKALEQRKQHTEQVDSDIESSQGTLSRLTEIQRALEGRTVSLRPSGEEIAIQ